MKVPTLILGAGGVGSELVLRVARMISTEQMKNIRLAILDTDANDINKIRNSGLPVKAIQISSDSTVGEALELDKCARNVWFPVHPLLLPKPLSEGAGQVRAIARLCFNAALRSGEFQPLHDAINELKRLTGGSTKQVMRVIVVGSLAGGTGSGIFLGLGMYLRKLLQSSAIIRGFFLLPEVFESAIEDEGQRNNLRRNAYAALRELDAFLMRSDGVLPDRYSNLQMEFSKPGSYEWEDYQVAPYDFAFLFDGQNLDGSCLPSFESYKEHAANCIYAQSIGSISAKSNSSEDNVILNLVAARGRNRYCGAGSAILEYPYEDVREYIALKWAQNSMSQHWLAADQVVEDKKRAHQRKLDEGYTDAEFDDIQEYIDAVESSENGFQKMIRAQCQFMDPDHPAIVQSDLWSNYQDSLLGYIKGQIVERESDLEDRAGLLTDTMIQNLVAPYDDPVDAGAYAGKVLSLYQNLLDYYDEAVRLTDPVAENMAYSILHFSKDPIREQQEHTFLLESFLKRQAGVIHPNAIRYMLCKSCKSLEEYLAYSKSKLLDAKGILSNFEHAFNDPSDEKINTVQDLVNSVYTPVKKGRRTRLVLREEARDKLRAEFSAFSKAAGEYRYYRAVEIVLTDVVAYIRSMIESFTVFYGSLQNEIIKLEERQNVLLTSHENDVGYARRLCCCSPECMEVLYREAPVTGSLSVLPGDLSALIYAKVRDYSLQAAQQKMVSAAPRRRTDGIRFEDYFPEENTAGTAYFTRIFDEVILKYWKHLVRSKADTLINMDIISALQKEAEIMKGYVDADDKRTYVIQAIEEAQRLATPFIERSYSIDCRPIEGCTYSAELVKQHYKDSQIIFDKYLKGGVLGDIGDSQVDRYQIIFYKSVYCIKALELPKFSAPMPARGNEHGGVYYRAYFDSIRRISCDSRETLVVSPHLNRNWHLVNALPDLDEANMKRQEQDIMRAFLRSLMFGRISYQKKSRVNDEYSYILRLKKGEGYWPEVLPTFNGTSCDRLYEVYDALIANPPIVAAINEDFENSCERERQGNISLAYCRFITALQSFRLPEIKEHFGLDKLTLFDLPLLYKLSAPRSEYQEECAILMLETFLDELYACICDHADSADVPQLFIAALRDQLEEFFGNLELLAEKQHGLKDDSLLRYYKQVVAEKLEMLDRFEEANIFSAIFSEKEII